MSLALPARRLAISAARTGAAALHHSKLLRGRLDPESIRAAAEKKTGLSDYGTGDWAEGLQRLCVDLEQHARLSPLGRHAARADLLQTLVNRLGLQAARSADPAIGKQRIEQPVFIVGLPRTGTTILHNLLAQDPENRTPMSWEVVFPCPPPARDAAALPDTRIARAESRLRWVDGYMPGFQAMHPVGAMLPQECIAITAHSFESYLFQCLYDVPDYQLWLDGRSRQGAYEFHQQFLQHLQLNDQRKRWVLKAPGHLWGVGEILRRYHKPVIIQTHRDPCAVMPSVTSLTAGLRGIFSDRIDPISLGAEMSLRWSGGLDRAIVERDADTSGALFIDFHFEKFMAEPLNSIAELYEQMGLQLSPTAHSAMQSFLISNPRGKHGVHRYSAADFGLDPIRQRRQFAGYCERFGVEQEIKR